MKTILVSGASGIVGYGILKSIKAAGLDHHLIGTSVFADSVAPAFCDMFLLAPYTSEDNYLTWLIQVIEKHKIDLLFPGIDADMYLWSEYRDEIQNTGAKIVINNPSLIKLCKDKWEFFKTLSESNLACTIPSILASDPSTLKDKIGFPMILKPRQGFGSKGVIRVLDEKDYVENKKKMDKNLLAQPLIGSDEEEYTTSAYCDGSGGYCASITMKRKLAKSGFTEQAIVVFDQKMDLLISELCKIFTPKGPTNFQFRKHENQYYLLEINPRVSSTASIRTAFGYNECHMAILDYLENITFAQPPIKKGRAVRYTEDHIFYE